MPALLIPGLVVLIAVFYVPLLMILCMSFASRVPGSFAIEYWPPTLTQYSEVFNPLYTHVFWTTLRVIGGSTLMTLFLGVPLALLISRQPLRRKNILLVLLMLPFFANFLARIYAWFILLKPNGILHSAHLLNGGWLNTEFALMLGIVSTYLPFLVYPVYFSFERIDPRLFDAARNLGASEWEIVRIVMLPLATPGIIAGLVMVALPALGEFLIAKLMGGGLVPIAAMLIETAFLGKITPNWPFGAAISVILMMAVALGVYILRFTTEYRSSGHNLV